MRVLILIILFVLHSPSSHAALGGAPSDLEVKNSTRKAQSLASVAHQNYRVNDSILSSGTGNIQASCRPNATFYATNFRS